MASGARLRSDNAAFGRATSGTAFLITAQPPPQPGIWTLDVGNISLLYSDTWNLPECNQGVISFAAWRHTASNVLSCALLNCEETGFRIRGRASGIETYMGVLEKGPGNCDAGCIIEVGPGVYNEGSRGTWQSAPFNRWLQGCGQYNPANLGYIEGERVDMLITSPWTNQILSVEPDTFAVFPRLTLANPHGLNPGMWVNISGSTLYDGVWEVFADRGANVLALYNTVRDYAGDDTGTLSGRYDYKEWSHTITVGQSGNEVGFESGLFGSINPTSVSGRGILRITANTATNLCRVNSVDNVGFFGSDDVALDFEGDNFYPHQIIQTVSFGGTYEAVDANMTAFLAGSVGGTINMNIREWE